mmetsp:Transcript_56137/g.92870  ORF Transcript_56137/g.92870 Transcript_56137/m.92870 type:complete len:286 (-) Transcript_56137:526-1383(-)
MNKRDASELLLQMRSDQKPVDPRLLERLLFLPPENREKVVEFIAEVCEEFSLQTQTAGLAVYYFDKYIANARNAGCGVELCALVCILIASKFVETKVPAVGELRNISDQEYSREEVKDAEIQVLQALGWELHAATPHAFLELFVVVLEISDACRKRADFLIDMSYYEYAILEFPPMVVAAASLACSWEQLGASEPESRNAETLSKLCGVEKVFFERCKQNLLDHFHSAFTLHASKDRNGADSPACVWDPLRPVTPTPEKGGASSVSFHPIPAPMMESNSAAYLDC